MTMKQRARAAQACIDRFAGKPYAPGKNDCVQMARHCLHHLGRGVGLGELPSYSTDAGGVKALKKLGYSTLVEALDGIGLERVAPAMALAGDIIALPTDHPLGALSIAVGNGRLLAYLDGHDGAVVIEPKAFICAWRAI